MLATRFVSLTTTRQCSIIASNNASISYAKINPTVGDFISNSAILGGNFNKISTLSSGGATGNNSVIIAGHNNSILETTTSSNNSCIIAGDNNKISSVKNCVVLAGNNMDAVKEGGVHLQALVVKDKANQTSRIGFVNLVSGMAIVSPIDLDANDTILLGHVTPGGVPGYIYVSARGVNGPGSSFTIKSSDNSDTSTVSYQIVRKF